MSEAGDKLKAALVQENEQREVLRNAAQQADEERKMFDATLMDGLHNEPVYRDYELEQESGQ